MQWLSIIMIKREWQCSINESKYRTKQSHYCSKMLLYGIFRGGYLWGRDLSIGVDTFVWFVCTVLILANNFYKGMSKCIALVRDKCFVSARENNDIERVGF